MRDVAIAGNAARALALHRVKKCIYISSSSVYGDLKSNLHITEDTPVRPSSLYGAAKLAGEQILEQSVQEHDIPLLILRPCMIYGPGSRDQGAYGPMKFARSIQKKGEIQIFGDGAELRDYVFIDDFAEIIFRLAASRKRGTYNIASGKSISFQRLADAFERLLKRRIRRVRIERDRPKSSQGFKTEKMRRVLPGFPFTSLQEGLKTLCGSDVRFSKERK